MKVLNIAFSMQPEGKEAMKEDFKKFSTAASSAYKNLPLSERKGLKLRSAVTLSSAAAKRDGTKIFNQIQKLVRHYNNNNYNNYNYNNNSSNKIIIIIIIIIIIDIFTKCNI